MQHEGLKAKFTIPAGFLGEAHIAPSTPLFLICREPWNSKWLIPHALRLGCPEMPWARKTVEICTGSEAHRLLPLFHQTLPVQVTP